MAAEAMDFWLKAGSMAAGRSAHKEAMASLEKGLGVLAAAAIPDDERQRRELAFLMILGPVLMAVHGYGSAEAQDMFERARHLIDDQTPAQEKLHVLCGLWNVRFHRAELASALALAQQCLDFAQGSGIGSDLANCLMGQTLASMGAFAAAQRHFQGVIDNHHAGTSDPARLVLVNEPVLARTYLAKILWARGRLEQAEAAVQAAMTLARQGSNAVTVATALSSRSFMAVYDAPSPDAIALADEAIAYCEEHELALFACWIRFTRGALQARQGDAEAGIEAMRAAIVAADARQSRQFRPFQLACVGAAVASLGRFEEALALLDEALAFAEAGGEKQSLAAIHRIRGEVLFRDGRREESGHAFAVAVETARRQEARMEELRAAMAAVRHATQSGRADACAALMEVYSSFHEGLALPDLQAARELLGLSPAG
jgi:tetratricopeptide (TPR) repeat protein